MECFDDVTNFLPRPLSIRKCPTLQDVPTIIWTVTNSFFQGIDLVDNLFDRETVGSTHAKDLFLSSK